MSLHPLRVVVMPFGRPFFFLQKVKLQESIESSTKFDPSLALALHNSASELYAIQNSMGWGGLLFRGIHPVEF